MRRLISIILVLSLFLLLPACAAANQPITDVDALEKGVIREKERADTLANGRNDGIREFAEKLKAKSDYTYIAKIDCLAYRILDRDLESLVKEMTEEPKEVQDE